MHPSRPGNYRCCFSSRFPRLTYLSKSSLVPCIPSLGWRGVALCHCTGGTAAEPLEPQLHMPSGAIITSQAPLLAACLASCVRLAGTGITYIILPILDCNPALPLSNSLHTPLCSRPSYAEPIPTRLPLLLPYSPAWSICHHAGVASTQLNTYAYSSHVSRQAIHCAATT